MTKQSIFFHINSLVSFVKMSNYDCKIVGKNKEQVSFLKQYLQKYNIKEKIKIITWKELLEELKSKEIKLKNKIFGYDMIDGYILSILDEEFRQIIKQSNYDSNCFYQVWLHPTLDFKWMV